MTWLFLAPLDVWLFRDGLPFTAGAERTARSLFPPPPFTLYGLLRATLLAQAARRRGSPEAWLDRESVHQDVGDPDDFTRLRLRGPFLARLAEQPPAGLNLLVPAPADLLADPEERTVTWRAPLRPDAARLAAEMSPLVDGATGGEDSAAAGPLPAPLWVGPAKSVPALQGTAPPYYVSLAGLAQALAGDIPNLVPAGALYDVEHRVGIGLAPGRRTTAEGLLYTAGFVRPRPGVGLAVESDELPLDPASGVVPFGGEARAATYTLDLAPCQVPWNAARDLVARTGQIKLVLATPALFAQGWLPDFVEPHSLATRAGSGQPRLRLVGAAVHRPRPIGGFDLVNRRPRPMRLAVPEGSVYFFTEEQTGEAVRAFDQWNGHALPGQVDGLEQIGFGVAYAGGWNYV